MTGGVAGELREQGRGLTGALLVLGLALLYTMEIWWHGWELPVWLLLAYAVIGLGAVMLVTRNVGFRSDADESENAGTERSNRSRIRRVVIDFSELVLQSLLAAYGTLLLFGVLEWGDPLSVVARLGLVTVVPLGFGAALANQLFTGASDQREFEFPQNVAVFALGATFVSAPIAPTQEMELIAAYAGWTRLAALVLVSLLVAHLMLYELEFQGQEQRVADRSTASLWTTTVIAYVTALAVVAGLLAGFGHFLEQPVTVWVQEVVVLGFPASVGASAAQVVLG